MLGSIRSILDVNIGSMAGEIVVWPEKNVHYNATKAGVHHLTKSFAPEWAPRGVRVYRRRAWPRRNAYEFFRVEAGLGDNKCLAQQHAYGEGRPNPRNCFDRVVSRL